MDVRTARGGRARSDVASVKRPKASRGDWRRTPIGPLYPAGWVLVGFFVVVIAYLFLDSETEGQVLPGFIADSRRSGSAKQATGWLCTVRTANDISFTAPCDANTAIGTTMWVCRRTRTWSGVTTYSMGAC
jgi:hypothetical protein